MRGRWPAAKPLVPQAVGLALRLPQRLVKGAGIAFHPEHVFTVQGPPDPQTPGIPGEHVVDRRA
jgi:hypothetical protein